MTMTELLNVALDQAIEPCVRAIVREHLPWDIAPWPFPVDPTGFTSVCSDRLSCQPYIAFHIVPRPQAGGTWYDPTAAPPTTGTALKMPTVRTTCR